MPPRGTDEAERIGEFHPGELFPGGIGEAEPPPLAEHEHGRAGLLEEGTPGERRRSPRPPFLRWRWLLGHGNLTLVGSLFGSWWHRHSCLCKTSHRQECRQECLCHQTETRLALFLAGV